MEVTKETSISLIRGLALVGLVPNIEAYFGRIRGIVRRKANVIVMSTKSCRKHIFRRRHVTTYDRLVSDAYPVDFY